MSTLSRRQPLSVLVLALAIVAAAWLVARPSSDAAAPPAKNQVAASAPVPGAGTVAFELSPSLTLPITSFQFGAARGVSNDGQTGGLSLSEATVGMASSAADPRLLKAIDTAVPIPTVTITSADPNQGRRQWVLTDVVVSSVSWARGAKSGDMSVSLNFGTVSLTTFNRTGQVVSTHCTENRSNAAC